MSKAREGLTEVPLGTKSDDDVEAHRGHDSGDDDGDAVQIVVPPPLPLSQSSSSLPQS
jgi:hypothetical protein